MITLKFVPRVLGLSGGRQAWYPWSTFADQVGGGATLAILVVFPVAALGFGAASVGLLLGISVAAGVTASAALGKLVDRLGARPWAVGSGLGAAATTTAIAFCPRSELAFAVLVSLRVLSRTAKGFSTTALVAQSYTDAQRRALLGRGRAAEHTGLAAGLAIGAVALAAHGVVLMQVALVFDAATFVVSAYLASRAPTRPGRERRSPEPGQSSGGRRGAGVSLRYVSVGALVGVQCVNYSLGVTGMSLWILRWTQLPRVAIAALLVVNICVTLATQEFWSRRVNGLRTARQALGFAGAGSAAACLLLIALAHASVAIAWPLVIVASTVVALAETALVTAAWELSIALGDPGSLGHHQAIWKVETTLMGEAGGNAVLGAIVSLGPVGIAGLAACFGCASLLTPLVLARHDQVETLPEEPTASAA